MSKIRLLDFQYKLEKTKQKARKCLSLRDRQASDLRQALDLRLASDLRQASDLTRCFEPNEEEMRNVFAKISSGKDKIDVDDLEALLHKMEIWRPGRKEAEMMLSVADMNRDGAVDFGEFMEVTCRRGGVKQGDIKNAFWAFDQDRDGRISAVEIQRMMERLGEACSLEDCQRMVRHVDRNGDGVVDMDEFMAMMTDTMKRI